MLTCVHAHAFLAIRMGVGGLELHISRLVFDSCCVGVDDLQVDCKTRVCAHRATLPLTSSTLAHTGVCHAAAFFASAGDAANRSCHFGIFRQDYLQLHVVALCTVRTAGLAQLLQRVFKYIQREGVAHHTQTAGTLATHTHLVQTRLIKPATEQIDCMASCYRSVCQRGIELTCLFTVSSFGSILQQVLVLSDWFGYCRSNNET